MNSEPANARLESVVFEIVADSRLNTQKSFAYIKDLSEHAHKHEALFILGSCFRLNKVFRRHDIKKTNSVVQMSLCDDDKYDLHELYTHTKNQYGTGKTNLLPFGNVLRLMGKFDLAEKYYRRFLNELPPKDPLQGELYYNFCLVAKAQGKFDESLEWYQKALDKLTQAHRSDNILLIGNIQNAIGEVYRAKNDHKRAPESFKQAVALFEHAKAEDHPDMVLFHDNIDMVLENQKNYSAPFVSYTGSLKIRQQHLPSNHQDLSRSFTNISTRRSCLNQLDNILVSFNCALEIRQKALPDNHSDVAVSYRNVGITYERQKALSSDHPVVIEVQQDIERISTLLKF